MRSIKQWYFDVMAEQLSELAGIQPQVIPEWGHRTQGGGYVCRYLLSAARRFITSVLLGSQGLISGRRLG